MGLGEVKFHDVDVDDAVISAAGIIQNTGSINLIPQGVTEITRVGRKCTITSILWHYALILPSTTDVANTSDVVRMIMYHDKQANGATATVLQILETDNYQSFRNLTETGRFNILMDKTFAMNTRGLGEAAGPITASSEWTISASFFKTVNIPIEYNSTLGALTEIRSNNIGILTVSKSGVCQLDSKIRLRFADG